MSNLGERIDREVQREIRSVLGKFSSTGAQTVTVRNALRAAGILERYWDGNKDLDAFTARKIMHDWHWRKVSEITKDGKIIRDWVKPVAGFTHKQAEEAAEVNKALAAANTDKCNTHRKKASTLTGHPFRQLMLFEQAV